MALPKGEEAAKLFSALGDKTRLHLVKRLCEEGPLSISELSLEAKVSRQAVSKHLKIMQEAGVVIGGRQGREVIYELEQKRLEIAKSYLAHISIRWDHALERLRIMVEDD